MRPGSAILMRALLASAALPVSGGVFSAVYFSRLPAGLNLRLGNMTPGVSEQAFTCSAAPGDPLPGDAVTVSVNAVNIRLLQDASYIWESTGGRITRTQTGVTVDTKDLAPGTYSIAGHLVHGAQRREVASCTTSFTVRKLEPPSVACNLDRAAINSGDSVTVTAMGQSPQNRPITYSYTTTNGTIAGNGATAALRTTGATPGIITVTCNATDDRGQSASAHASLVVATSQPPLTQNLPQARSLCSISFERDRLRLDRVDNEAKACLDDVALTLNREVGAKLLIIGTHSAIESNRNAAERAMNAALYLAAEKGVDPARLDLRISPAPGKTVLMTLIPAGALPDAAAGESFDTSTVHRSGQPYAKPNAAPRRAIRHHAMVRPVVPKKRRKVKISEF